MEKLNIDAFRTDLANGVLCRDIDWINSVSTDELFNVYNLEMTALLDRHAPRYTRKRKRRLLTPWFDDDCRQMKHRLRILERRYRKSHDPSDRLVWVKKLQEQARFYQEKERCYWSCRINANASNARRLWRDLDDLMKRDDNSANIHTSAAEAVHQADKFLSFFEGKVESVRKETENAPQPNFQASSFEGKFANFQQTTPGEIVKLITSANNKYCSLDPVPTDVVKKCSDLLSNFISQIFNRSLSEGHLPQSQKVAHIIPHLKKRGLDEQDFKSYRPVSNLPFLSKLLERTVAAQMNDFLLSNSALPTFQSAYRQNHSTESALLKVFSDLCRAVDDGNTCLLGLLDMSAAFDTVDHEILLKRLEITFGICGVTLQWFKSYLADRMQAVNIMGHSSTFTRLRHGVPQGSVLGPLLFLLYTAPIAEIIMHHGLSHHCYADDTQVYFYCPPDQMPSLVARFASCIRDVEQWMCSNRLKLNCDKTELLWIASSHTFQSVGPMPPVVIGSSTVQPSNGARNLGFYFDRQLDMKQHISNICRSCFFSITSASCHPKDVA